MQSFVRDAAFDTLPANMGLALAADRTLGDLFDWVEAEAPRPIDLAIEGEAGLEAAMIPAVLHYPWPTRWPDQTLKQENTLARAQMALAFETVYGTLPAQAAAAAAELRTSRLRPRSVGADQGRCDGRWRCRVAG